MVGEAEEQKEEEEEEEKEEEELENEAYEEVDFDISSDQFKNNVLAALKCKIANHDYQKKCEIYHKLTEKANAKWVLGTGYISLQKVYRKIKK